MRERRDSEICSFAPQLCRPERSNRMLQGLENGSDPHMRTTRTYPQRAHRQQWHEEQQFAEEMQQGSFTPNISESVQPAQSTSRHDRPRIQRPVTPERAAEFYGQQVAWREACLKQRHLTWEEQCNTTLH